MKRVLFLIKGLGRGGAERLLAEVEAFEDLPGWWQAALLAAEQERPTGHGHCCGHR